MVSSLISLSPLLPPWRNLQHPLSPSIWTCAVGRAGETGSPGCMQVGEKDGLRGLLLKQDSMWLGGENKTVWPVHGRPWQDWGGVKSHGSRRVALGIAVCGGKASKHWIFLKSSLSVSLLSWESKWSQFLVSHTLPSHHPYFCVKVQLNHWLAEINKTLNMSYVGAGGKKKKL